MKPSPASASLLLALLMAAAGSYAQPNTPSLPTTKNKEEPMQSRQTNKAIIRNLYENALNKHQLNTLDRYVAADYTGPKAGKGPAGFGAPLQQLIDAFPDIQWHIEEMIAEGDKVMIRWTLKGTHLAPYNDVSATGKKISIYGIGIFSLQHGLVVSSSSYTDRLGFLQQLGMLPADIGAPAGNAKGSKGSEGGRGKQ